MSMFDVAVLSSVACVSSETREWCHVPEGMYDIDSYEGWHLLKVSLRIKKIDLDQCDHVIYPSRSATRSTREDRITWSCGSGRGQIHSIYHPGRFLECSILHHIIDGKLPSPSSPLSWQFPRCCKSSHCSCAHSEPFCRVFRANHFSCLVAANIMYHSACLPSWSTPHTQSIIKKHLS